MIRRAACAVCSKHVPIRLNGTTYDHNSVQPRSADPEDGDDYVQCPGTHTPPKAG